MTQEELINVFKYIVKKCDMLINNDNYEADAYTQDTVEDIAELCNHILDGDYGKLIEVKEPASKLTWQDIQRIVKIADQIVDENRGKFMAMEDEDYYKEVLERYVKQSEKP